MSNRLSRDEIIHPGTPVGDWTVERILGCGATGIVYRVHRTAMPCRLAALKILRAKCGYTSDNFAAEIRFLKCRPIPGFIPEYHDEGTHDGMPFYTMELAQSIGRNLSVRNAYRIFSNAADAVAALHKRAFCHGDIKPDNLGRINGRTVLLDLGHGYQCHPVEEHGPLMTTPGFLAQSVKDKGCATRNGDVHALALAMRDCCGPRARAVFAPAIDEALSLIDRPSTVTAKEFREKLSDCYKKQLGRIAVRSVFIALVAIVLGVIAIYSGGYYFTLKTVEDKHLEQNEMIATVGLVHHYYDNPAHRDTAKAFHYCEKALANEAALDDKERGYIHGVMGECYWNGDGCAVNPVLSRQHAEIAASLGDPLGTARLSVILEQK